MGLKETHFCDMCKNQVESGKDLRVVSYGIYNYTHGFDPQCPKFKIDMCAACREKIGLVERVIKNDQIVERDVKTTAENFFAVLVKLHYELHQADPDYEVDEN